MGVEDYDRKDSEVEYGWQCYEQTVALISLFIDGVGDMKNSGIVFREIIQFSIIMYGVLAGVYYLGMAKLTFAKPDSLMGVIGGIVAILSSGVSIL